MHTDPIADMLTRIRNAQAVGKPEIVLPYSKAKKAIADVLLKEGWIMGVEKIPGLKLTKKQLDAVKRVKQFDYLKIDIKYVNSKPKIQSIKRISKPGMRVYVNKSQLPIVLSHYGVAIISTSKGLMTNKEAQKAGIGGEVICEIY